MAYTFLAKRTTSIPFAGIRKAVERAPRMEAGGLAVPMAMTAEDQFAPDLKAAEKSITPMTGSSTGRANLSARLRFPE